MYTHTHIYICIYIYQHTHTHSHAHIQVLELHMGYNLLPRIDVTFFRMPVLRELNLDQNELEEISAGVCVCVSMSISDEMLSVAEKS